MFFESLARANKCVLIHNVRDFPQAKFDIEITARSLSNKHRKVPFYCIKLIYNSLPFHLMKKKILPSGKKNTAKIVYLPFVP